jgi:hypothetical protein
LLKIRLLLQSVQIKVKTKLMGSGAPPLGQSLWRFVSRIWPGIFLCAVLLAAVVSQLSVREGNDFYVAPSGRALATGTINDPWDLQTALSQPKVVSPGDTIWLRGGLYAGVFESSLKGEPNRPIIVRAFSGERATIDTGTAASGAGLFVRGSDCWYWGIEIMSSYPNRASAEKGSAPSDLKRVPGVVVHGPRTKFINMVVHDTAGGYGFWTPAEDSEIYGNVLFYNGWSAPDRGHGHGIYSQNKSGKKRIEDTISFSNFGMGIRAYGSGDAFVNNIEFVGNVSFNAGILYGSPPRRWSNFFVTGGKGAQDILFDSNYSYHRPGENQGQSSLGWVFSQTEQNVVARNNYWIGGSPAIEVWNWNDVTFQGNVAYSEGGLVFVLNHLSEQDRSKYHLDGNTYYGSDLMRLNGKNSRWSQWQQITGLDTNSTHHPGRPKGSWVFVRPNKYEHGRANVIIYNWDLRDQVAVDLSNVLTKGQNYEIVDAQNFYGTNPVLKGTYEGGSISVPMKGLTVASPVGLPQPQHTAPEFGVFVVRQNDGSNLENRAPEARPNAAGRPAPALKSQALTQDID